MENLDPKIENPNKYDDWNKFDPREYAKRNYEKMLPEDERIIKEIAEAMKKFGVNKGQFNNVADVGAGPNLYPSMILSPFVKEGGAINLIEYSSSNRDYLHKVLGDIPEGEYSTHLNNWKDYAEKIKEVNGEDYLDCFDKMKQLVNIKEGSIYDLPKEKFDAVSSFFCTESITDNMEEFKKALNSLLNSLKPGGIFVITHMLQSEGYFAGEGTNFPAISLTTDDLEEVYKNSESKLKSFIVKKVIAGEDEEKPREGYHGMAVVIGQKV